MKIENTNSLVEEKDNVYEARNQFIQSGVSVEGDNYFIIGYKAKVPSSVPSRYILEKDYLIRFRSLGTIDKTAWHILQSDIDRFLFRVYPIQNGEMINTLNIKQIFEDNCPTLQLTSLSSYHIRPYRNEPCIVFDLEKRPESFEDGLEDTYKRAYLNIETEQFQIMDYSREQWEVDERRRSQWAIKGYVLNDPEYSFLELNGIEEAAIGYSNYWDGMCEIYLPIHQLPAENERLYEMFPQLKEKVREILE